MGFYKNWWSMTIRGVLFVLIGLICLLVPHITVITLMVYTGIVLIISGVVLMLSAYSAGKKGFKNALNWWMVEGIFDIIIGLLIAFNPVVTAKLFFVFLALWAMFLGAIRAISAYSSRDYSSGWKLQLLFGLLTFLLGLLLLTNPFSGAIALIVVLGTFLLFIGFLLLAKSFELKKHEDEIQVF
jgi:uncharacterized membrane protein HdeD (DUF308 family)